jgi:cytochrome c biogenesis protein CcdA/thiol-disulfide isomerase/thioredoxin
VSVGKREQYSYNKSTLLLLISFIAGILTILAPCVLPVIPIIIGGSVSGGAAHKLRPYIIGISLALSIIIFTLLLKVSTSLANVSARDLNWFSGGLLIALGFVSIFPNLWEKFMIAINLEVASQRWLGQSQRTKGVYTGAILIGIALGPVFASCSPTYAFILASVLPGSFLAGLIYLIAYTIGLAAALLAVSLAGRKLISRMRWAVDTHSLFRRLLGILFVLIGIAVITGFEVSAETWLASKLPFDETKVERILLDSQHQSLAQSKTPTRGSVLNVGATPAPALVGLTNWINSPALKLSQLKGKVVLVDFWTYSCINCIRTLPYIEKWYETYKDKGFVVIGVNTPEFAFEHDPSNVASAVKSDGITYPVALDNNYDTWNAYKNDSWPADYLIDKDGNIQYTSVGEGGYTTTETAIQELLGIDQPLQATNNNVPIGEEQTPETYFGTNREDAYTGSPDITQETGATATFTPASQLAADEWTLSGAWDIEGPSITSMSASSTLTISTFAKDVYLVAAPSSAGPGTVTVGLPSADSGSYGSDAPGGAVTVDQSRLYHIVSLPTAKASTVTLTVPAGVTLYTFTFGS